MKNKIIVTIALILLILPVVSCGSNIADPAVIPEGAEKEEVSETNETETKDTETKDPEKKDSKEAASEEKTEAKDTAEQSFPYGIDKLRPIMESIGYGILVDKGYEKGNEWRTIGIALRMDLNSFMENDKYRYDDMSGVLYVPADVVREYYSVLDPDFTGELPELPDSYMRFEYDEKTDSYGFGMGDFGIDEPVCEGFRKTDDGYEMLCGTKGEDPESGEMVDHDEHGLVTLIHNKYSDTLEDPMFMWTVSDVKVIGQKEYEDLLSNGFSKNDLLPVAEAYAGFLADYRTEDFVGNLGVKYGCGYVDEDEIPELFVVQDNAHNATITLYAYRDGEVRKIGDFGSLGSGRYIPYRNILLDHYWGSGADYTTFLRMEGDSLKPFGYVENEPEDITNYDPEHLIYLIAKDDISDTVEVSKEEYENKYRENAGGNPAAAVEVSYTGSTYVVLSNQNAILSGVKQMLGIY